MSSPTRVSPEHRAEHTPEAIQRRLSEGPSHSYLRDFVYGAIDGAVTTFAVVSGVAGAGLSTNIVIILGVANLLGDGFSMAAGNYLGTKAEAEQRERTRQMEERHIASFPDGEREEIRQIYAGQGFSGDLLEQIVEVITADRERWVHTMLREEHGLPSIVPHPLRAAATTLIAFILVGMVPLVPFIVGFLITIPQPYVVSTVMTAVAFFLVGMAKSRFVEQSWYKAGTETLVIGSLAAGLAFLSGMVLKFVA
ncbi:MAG: VIT1/CCC1 transporter family protein [Planctomycetaceae bacterium]|nr:VIT1/CCC1 transporter family protein [Planctomycetaceae bacterium]